MFKPALISLLFLCLVVSPLRGAGQDVRLIIDVSGSMKKNDPENLRVPAVNLLVKLLPDGANSGVWLFGHQVAPLVSHGSVNAGWKKNALKSAAGIHSRGLYTNIGAALEQALLT